jgi:hypothetical protein
VAPERSFVRCIGVVVGRVGFVCVCRHSNGFECLCSIGTVICLCSKRAVEISELSSSEIETLINMSVNNVRIELFGQRQF